MAKYCWLRSKSDKFVGKWCETARHILMFYPKWLNVHYILMLMHTKFPHKKYSRKLAINFELFKSGNCMSLLPNGNPILSPRMNWVVFSGPYWLWVEQIRDNYIVHTIYIHQPNRNHFHASYIIFVVHEIYGYITLSTCTNLNFRHFGYGNDIAISHSSHFDTRNG